MLKHHVDCHSLNRGLRGPAERKTVGIDEIVENLYDAIAGFPEDLNYRRHFSAILRMYGNIQVAGQAMGEFFPGVQNTVADTANIQSFEKPQKKLFPPLMRFEPIMRLKPRDLETQRAVKHVGSA